MAILNTGDLSFGCHIDLKNRYDLWSIANKPKYSYCLLDSVQPNTKVNVYGVVKFAKQPYKSRGNDYCMMLSIVDETLTGYDQKLKCLLFAHTEGQLPPAQVGDIIRFHRLKISRFAGDLQGQSCPGYSWVLFSGDPGGTLEPKAKSSQNVTLPDEEKQKIEDLRIWASGHGLAKTYSRFKNIAAGCYFDIICQVIGTCVVDDTCILLNVWDGTQTIYPVRVIDTRSAGDDMNLDIHLLARAEGLVYDLCLFDDHVHCGQKIKPGDYIELCNLHAAVFKTPGTTPLDTVELVLHRGTSFGRGVKVLDPDADIPELTKLKKDLDKIHAQFQSDEVSMNDSELVRAADSASGKMKEKDDERPSTSREDNLGGQGQSSGSSVEFIESARTSDKETKNSDSVPIIENYQASNSSDSVQILDSVQTSGEDASSYRTRPKRKQTEEKSDENVLSVKGLQTSEKSCAAKKHSEDSKRSVQLKDKNQSTRMSTESCKRPREEIEIQSAQDTGTVGTDGSLDKQSGSLQRCMLKTATIILNHPHVPRSTISDVLQHAVPYKFKVRARVYDYHPKPTSVDHFLQLYCNICHYLSPMPGLDSANNNSKNVSQLHIGSTFKGVPHYNCPQCLTQKDSLQVFDSPPHLSYIYMMRLLLRDDTGWLLTNIWKEEAETFFRDVTPEELIQNKKQLKIIQDCLQQICPDSVVLEEKPWIECCIRTYSNDDGTGFQIFDTVIA